MDVKVCDKWSSTIARIPSPWGISQQISRFIHTRPGSWFNALIGVSRCAWIRAHEPKADGRINLAASCAPIYSCLSWSCDVFAVAAGELGCCALRARY
jgi:hypothetical protein